MAALKTRPKSSRQYVAQPVPGFVDFQHPQLVDKPPEGERWVHEVKWDPIASSYMSRVVGR